MPEGDTIHRTAKALGRALTGQPVTAFSCAFAQPTAVADQTPVVGSTVLAVRAVGKHLFIDFSNALTLRTHMRMNGSWHLYRPGEPWQRSAQAQRVRLDTQAFVAVAFDVPVIELLRTAALERHRVVGALGPDLLAPGFNEAEALERMGAQGPRALGEVLLDQRVVAGIGNVYKSELCFLIGVDPRTPLAQVPVERRVALLQQARRLMQANVHIGGEGPVTYTGLRRTTRAETPGANLWVYGRSGSPCRRCTTRIEFFKQGDAARSTYVCPRCQPRSAP